MSAEEKYSTSESDRRRDVNAILNSQDRKRIIVAGPGTGKTFLFKELLKDGRKKALTLTFVNSLVEDLALELHGLSEVRTLHGFARSILSQATGSVAVFPLLSNVIREDLKVSEGVEVNFDSVFNNREDNHQSIPFYKSRKDFYGHNGHTDLVYAAALFLEKNPKRIPAYDWVLVDEFQDFNALEVSLINLLANKNQILVAGDDDQALYYFKEASPHHIRDRYHQKIDKYTSFNLSHCSRCTRVIVDAFNDVVKEAVKAGFLKQRIDKRFVYFEEKRKNIDSDKYQKLVHLSVHSSQIPYAIGNELDVIASNLTEQFSVLVIAPTKNQCRSIAKSLSRKGFRNVSFVDREQKKEPDLLDGVLLLLNDKNSNLGWRVVAKSQLPEADFNRVIRESIGDPAKRFQDIVDPAYRKRVKKLLSGVRKVAKGREISAVDFQDVLDEFGLDPAEIAKKDLHGKLQTPPEAAGIAGLRDLPLKVTTIPGAKGLSEDYVFMVHFDDRFYLDKDDGITDQNICNLLVALTRARKCIYLISCQPGQPKFLNWISKDRIEARNLRGER
ncbi:UvrD-helicase domain-containing protein [Tardiphaga sp. 619_E2_N8_5]|uniref:UvrD-helicase domain-containing protein n=1 Tax=unclassified Tardiphaga TaxID=2631404 RepID=UPI003F1F799D